jgi:K+-sensing histidine kinase KdpD
MRHYQQLEWRIFVSIRALEGDKDEMTNNPREFSAERAAMMRLVFSSVAHDVKTPLACIIGSLETIEYLKDQLASDKRDALIASALGQAHRLNTLFDAMLANADPT